MSEPDRKDPQEQAARRRQEDEELAQRMAGIDRKLLVLSGKGGVGKSTVAANLAAALALAGKRVGLLDVDMHGPSISNIMNLAGHQFGAGPEGTIRPIALAENLLVVSLGPLLKDRSDAVIWRGPMKYNVIRQFLKDVEWGELDFLVVDSPPGTGDEPLSIAQMIGRNAAGLIVTTPQDVAIADVRRSVSFCRQVNLPVAGIIENMSGQICPHCGGHIEPFKSGGGEKLAEEMDVPFLGRIPLEPKIVESGDLGRPFVQAFADSPAAAAFAAAIAPLTEPGENAPERSLQGPAGGELVAIPTAGGRLCPHFGHCEKFALVQVDRERKQVGQTTWLNPPVHEPGALPRFLHDQGAKVIIAGGMGQKARTLFEEKGIQVVVGAPAEPAEEVARAYLEGRLELGENTCDH